MSAITFALRFLPARLLTGRQLPKGVMQWLKHVPVAVMAAMLVPGLLLPDGKQLSFDFSNLFLWCALPTAALGFVTRSFVTTVVAGVCLVAAVRYFGMGVA